MNLKGRLAKLETAADEARPAHEEPASHQWLTVLDSLATCLGEMTGEHAEVCRDLAPEVGDAAELLRGYVQSGRVGPFVEYHCNGALLTYAAWYHGKGQPFPIRPDEAEHLRQCLQIDQSRNWGASA